MAASICARALAVPCLLRRRASFVPPSAVARSPRNLSHPSRLSQATHCSRSGGPRRVERPGGPELSTTGFSRARPVTEIHHRNARPPQLTQGTFRCSGWTLRSWKGNGPGAGEESLTTSRRVGHLGCSARYVDRSLSSSHSLSF